MTQTQTQTQISKVPVEEIIIGERRRTDLGDMESLQKSIAKIGLVNAIIIDENKKLVAGERRLICFKNLGLPEIDVKYYKNLSELDHKVIEMEENLHKELTWFERGQLRNDIHLLQCAIKGTAVKGHESSGQSLEASAEMMSINIATLSQDIALIEASKIAPQLTKFVSRRQALKAMNKLKEMAILTELARRDAKEGVGLAFTSQSYILVNADCISYIKENVADESIDLIIFDPPWGVDIDIIASRRGPSGEKTFYNDSEEASRTLIKQLLPELFRVMKTPSHMYMFVGYQHVRYWGNILANRKEIMQPDWTMKIETLEEKRPWTLDSRPIPLVWIKEGGGFTDMEYRFMPRYEAILFCAKGSRRLNYPFSDVFESIRPLTTERIHPQQKPVKLIKEFIKLSSHPNELVLDPCTGSGTTIVASLLSGRRAIGIEKDTEAFLRADNWIKGIKIGEDEDEEETNNEKTVDESPTTFEGMVPGSKDWKTFWKAHPEAQDEMLKYKAGYSENGNLGAGVEE